MASDTRGSTIPIAERGLKRLVQQPAVSANQWVRQVITSKFSGGHYFSVGMGIPPTSSHQDAPPSIVAPAFGVRSRWWAFLAQNAIERERVHYV
jgi:hypothetical protein